VTIGSRSRPERSDHCMGSPRSGSTVTLADRGRDPAWMTRSDDRSGDDRCPLRGRMGQLDGVARCRGLGSDSLPHARPSGSGGRGRAVARGAPLKAGAKGTSARTGEPGPESMRKRIAFATTDDLRATVKAGTDRAVAVPYGGDLKLGLCVPVFGGLAIFPPLGVVVSGAVTPGTTTSSRPAPAEQSRRGRLARRPERPQRPPERDSWHGRHDGPQRMLLSPPRRHRATDRGVSRRGSILWPWPVEWKGQRVRDCVRLIPE
jgi:hypothetical protein